MIRDFKCRRSGAAIIIAGIISLSGCGSGVTMKNYGTAEEQYRAAFSEYQKGHYLKSVDGFQKVIYNFSGASMVDSAQYFLAMAYYQQHDYYMAAAEFDRLVNTYRGSPYIDDGQYMAGVCYFKSAPKNYGLDQEELNKAIGALQDFITDNPESELVEDARLTLQAANDRLARKRYENGRMYFRLGYYESAAIYFQSVIDEHTSSEWAAKALYYMAEVDFKKKHFEAAKEKFNNFLVVYPDHEFTDKARKKLAKIDEDLAKAAENN